MYAIISRSFPPYIMCDADVILTIPKSHDKSMIKKGIMRNNL